MSKIPTILVRAIGGTANYGEVIYDGGGQITIEVAGLKYSIYANGDGSLRVFGANGSLCIRPEGGVNAVSIMQVPDLVPVKVVEEELRKDHRYDFPTAE